MGTLYVFWRELSAVMPGLVPGIHAFLAIAQDMDGRVKPGHDRTGHDGVWGHDIALRPAYITPRPAPSGFLALEKTP